MEMIEALRLRCVRLKAAHQSVYMKIGQNNHVRATQFYMLPHSIMGRYAREPGKARCRTSSMRSARRASISPHQMRAFFFL